MRTSRSALFLATLTAFIILGAFVCAREAAAATEALFFSTSTNQFAPGIGTIQNQDVYAILSGDLRIRRGVDSFLPVAVGLDAIDVQDNNHIYFSVSTSGGVNHAGGFIDLRQDNVYLLDVNTRVITTAVDWSAQGVEPGSLDALDVRDDGTVVFSTQTTRQVPQAGGGAIILKPQNAYAFDPVSKLVQLAFDGDHLGLRDLDAIAVLSTTQVAFSTATNQSVRTPGGSIYLKNQNVYVFDRAADAVLPTPLLNGESLGLQSLDAFSVGNPLIIELEAIAVTPAAAELVRVGETVQLSVQGTLTDGTTIDLTAASSGTTYRSHNISVAVVSENGLVTAVGGGTTDVLVANGGKSAVVSITVSITSLRGGLIVTGTPSGGSYLAIQSHEGAPPAVLLTAAPDGSGNLTVSNAGGVPSISLNGSSGAIQASTVQSTGTTTVGSLDVTGTVTAASVQVTGTTRTGVLEITGGDLAEPFRTSGSIAIPAGAVVVIDDQHSGQLALSDRPYDRRVAGVVSGAGGIEPGVILYRRSLSEEGQHVALVGRVYALADASTNPIRPGDLLTTSAILGRVMKVTDYQRAQGAVIGKAMSSLDGGQGLVLVLVNLQ